MTETEMDDFASLITKLQKPAGTQLEKFTPYLVKLMVAGAKFSGFWSAEILPPAVDESNEWSLVQRFKGLEEASAWHTSEARRTVISEIISSANGNDLAVTDELRKDAKSDVATAIVTDVKPGMEEAYFAWEIKIQSAQASFPGYCGSYMQPPVPSRPGQWATLLRFNSPEALEKWFASPERKQLLEEGQAFVKSTQIKQVTSSFPGWFPTDSAGNGPPNWKAAQLVVLGLFPIVMLQIKYCNPYYASLNQISPTIGNVINMIVSCSGVTWVTMPLFIKLFGFWMFPELRTTKVDLLGQLAVLGFLAVEMALLWHLL